MKKILWITAGAMLVLAAAGGGYWYMQHNKVAAEPEVPGLRPQEANPASVFCGTLGGKVTIKDAASGQVGICDLPDGRHCEEWALFQKNECVAG